MAFIDECKIMFKAGKGGDGIVSWRREAHVPMGGPAGGDGGDGGSVILIGDHNENSLQDLKFKRHIIANDGEKGQIKTMHGQNGPDTLVKVPLGTIVHDADNNEQIVDIDHQGQQFVICKGGLGGHGNFHFKSGYNKAPTLYELGDLGETRECKLVLKQIADIGLVGLPNAGKSTLINQISAAKSKTANYQFTTLTPVLGTVFFKDQRIIFADIPGLIEGASSGLGLGHDFLKHIERTSVLIHLVSMDDIDGVDPYKNYQTIMHELETYSPILVQKPMLIVANKMDAPNAKAKFTRFQKKLSQYKIISASTELGENIDIILDRSFKMWSDYQKHKPVNADIQIITYERDLKPDEKLSRELKITQPYDNYWNVECDFLKYWAHKIVLNTPDNIIRFNQKMKTACVEEKLKKLGAVKGDTIKIYSVEMQYED